ncbi:holin family protein [Roseobacteraceae bacterium S113]
MGIIERIFAGLFGGGRNTIAETIEVFRENAENGADRAHEVQTATLAQFAKEFRVAHRSRFDRLMDAINRLPRPAMALGTLGLFVTAMVDPVWFAARMQGIALVPEPLWWLLGAIVSFYFGARHQAKGQAFQREMVGSVAQVHGVVDNLRALDALQNGADQTEAIDNPALQEWRRAG